MVALFQADIFSGASPRFSEAAAQADAEVRRVAAALYPNVLGRIERVAQFGGNEINSNNFRIGTAAGTFLLKRLPAKSNPTTLRRQLDLSIWLRESAQVNLPPVLRSGSAESLAGDGNSYWCLFEFVPGDFFSGGDGQLESTAREIGRMQQALRSHPISLRPPVKWQYQTEDDAAVFRAVEARRKDLPALFGQARGDELSQEWDRVLQVEALLRSQASRFRELRVDACHCDLHPHNILMDGDTLAAFIDFESFTFMPVAAALGFATYKLVRQHAVRGCLTADDAGAIQLAAARFLNGLRQAGIAEDAGVADLRLMALAEIFRRLLVIFRLNVRDGDPAWNHVMPMHLAGLQEIELMFRAETHSGHGR